jgi:hypothetical protein
MCEKRKFFFYLISPHNKSEFLRTFKLNGTFHDAIGDEEKDKKNTFLFQNFPNAQEL